MVVANYTDYQSFKKSIKDLKPTKVIVIKTTSETTHFEATAVIVGNDVTMRLFLPVEPNHFDNDFDIVTSADTVTAQ